MAAARAGKKRRDREGRLSGLLPALGLVLASLTAVYLPPGIQQRAAHLFRASVLRPFIEANVAISQTQARTRGFEVLRAQMDSAMGFVASHRTLAEENRQLRGLLSLGGRPAMEYVAVSIMRPGTAGSSSVFRVGAGSRRGIAAFGAVVTGDGLLGQVQDAWPDYSMAIDWSHRDFRAAAMTADGGSHGLIEAERGGFREQDRLVLSGAAFLSDLEPGTEIVTSGRGGALPRGIRIGWIAGVAATSAGWSKSYYVTPSVHPGSATYAAVAIPAAEDGSAAAALEAPEDPPATAAR